jgi:hypothetical protein
VADILRITTPLVTKNPPSLQRQAEPNEVFSLQELVKVVKANPQSELLMQNNALIEEGGRSSMLIDILKDPSAAVGFLRNILVLQEILGLLPLNNEAVSPEIRNMFESLFVPRDEIVSELIRQENAATVFKGTFFDFIRQLLRDGADPDILIPSLRLLKAVSNTLGSRDALDSVANGLQFLADALSPSRYLSEKLSEISQAFRRPVTQERLAELKSNLLPLFAEIENSVLFSPKIEKLIPLITYNLSRYNDNTELIAEIAVKFSEFFESGDAKAAFLEALRSVLIRPESAGQALSASESAFGSAAEQAMTATEQIDTDMVRPESIQTGKPSGDPPAAGEKTGEIPERSRVLDTLVRIISDQADRGDISPASKSRLEKVIYSLLSSPSNFTPLLHFIIPVKYEDVMAFAELWINPNGEEDTVGDRDERRTGCIHLLAVFDVIEIGRFEAELFARGRNIELSLLCPPEYIDWFIPLERGIRQSAADAGFRFERFSIGKLVRTRSLIEVFTSLPQRRMGIDIRV